MQLKCKFVSSPFQHNIEYQIVGTVPAPYYFQIDPRSGVVSIKNSVATGSDTTYTVTFFSYLPHELKGTLKYMFLIDLFLGFEIIKQNSIGCAYGCKVIKSVAEE